MVFFEAVEPAVLAMGYIDIDSATHSSHVSTNSSLEMEARIRADSVELATEALVSGVCMPKPKGTGCADLAALTARQFHLRK